ncbi:RNA polymerase sigma factor [Cytophagaceae bacterium ABcell3]|nr:RNA polymerase sigma factor [Cytophagaceae bacterium ABcell3]
MALSEEILKEIYELHKAQVYNTALGMVQNVSDAEEITQDVFVDVFFNIQKFEGKSALRTWIYRITVNKSLDHLKSNKRKKRFAWLTSLFDPESGKVLHEQADFSHPGVKLENQENSAILFTEINKLPENQKTAFILSQMEGLSGKEISKIMEVSESAVESLLVRAKKNLRKWLGDFYNSYKS